MPKFRSVRAAGDPEADAGDAMPEGVDEARRLGRPVPFIAEAYLSPLRRPAA